MAKLVGVIVSLLCFIGTAAAAQPELEPRCQLRARSRSFGSRLIESVRPKRIGPTSRRFRTAFTLHWQRSGFSRLQGVGPLPGTI